LPGPLPKPASQRRRRNRTVKPTTLGKGGGKAPRLLNEKELLPETRAWWATVWGSPMAAVWLDADVPALTRLAGLVDRLHRGEGTSRVLGEIRALEDRFGLSPMARRRLQWEIEQASTVIDRPTAGEQEERWLRAVSDSSGR
jgi:hypothetical protein